MSRAAHQLIYYRLSKTNATKREAADVVPAVTVNAIVTRAADAITDRNGNTIKTR